MKGRIEKVGWSVLAALLIALFTFLRIQTDDELYLSFESFHVSAGAFDTSEGIIALPAGTELPAGEIYASSKSFDLPKGSYRAEIEYEYSEDGVIRLTDGEALLAEFPLGHDQIREEITFSLSRRANDFKVRLISPGPKTPLIFKHIAFDCDRLLFRDHLFLGLFLIALVFALPLLSDKGWISFRSLPVVFCILFASYPLFAPDLVTGHDTVFHMMRIEGIADALLDGQFPAVIYPEAAFDHGYIGALYPNLFLYIPAALRLLNVSAAGAYRFTWILINIASFASAFYAVKTILKNRNAGLFAGMLFCLAPFRLIDVYYRSTLGESLAFVFFPLLVAGLYRILIADGEEEGSAENGKRVVPWLPLMLGMSGMVESHILSALYGGAVCLLFCLVFFKKLLEKERLLALGRAAVSTLLVNLGFFVPFFYYRSQDLQLDDTIRRFNPKELAVSLADTFRILPYLYSDNEYTLLHRTMVPVLGVTGLLGLCLTAAWLVSEAKKDLLRRFIAVSFALELFLIYFSSDLFPWATLEKFPGLYHQLYLLEHPWRVFEIVVTLLAVTVPVAVFRLSELKPYRFAAAGMLVILTVATAALQMDLYRNRGTTIGELQGNTAWSYNVDYMPHYFTSLEDCEKNQEPAGTGSVHVTDFHKEGTTVDFRYSGASGESAVGLPLLYYYGYHAEDETGAALGVSESETGTVQVTLPSRESGSVHVHFTQPWFNTAAFGVSLLFVLWLCTCGIIRRRKKHAQN